MPRPSPWRPTSPFRTETRANWNARIEATGMNQAELIQALEEAGVAGIFTSSWTGNWGSSRVSGSPEPGGPEHRLRV